MKVLFLGNSLTYFFDLPKMVEGMCREAGMDFTADSVTRGGAYLSDFLNPDDVECCQAATKKLNDNVYDYVVVQEQSTRPAVATAKFHESARELVSRIRATGAEPVFYETWSKRTGSEALGYTGLTHEQLQKGLHDAYEAIGKELGADVVFAGDRFDEAYLGEQGDAVYHPDGSHPAEIGTRIAAKAFFDYFKTK